MIIRPALRVFRSKMGSVRNRLAFDFERIIKPVPSYGQVWCEREREGSWQTVGEEGERKGGINSRRHGLGDHHMSHHMKTSPMSCAKWSDDRYRRSELDSVLSAEVSSFEHEQLTMLISDPIQLCGSLERLFQDWLTSSRISVSIILLRRHKWSDARYRRSELDSVLGAKVSTEFF